MDADTRDKKRIIDTLQLLSLKNEEERIRSIPSNERTPKENQQIAALDAMLTQFNNGFLLDEVPPPFQLPPCVDKKQRELPVAYSYTCECHLNWQRVITFNNKTKEIVGIVESVGTRLIPPDVSICRDGKCSREECKQSNFNILQDRLKNYFAWKKSEDEREESFYLYGKKAIIYEDDYGYFVDGTQDVSDEDSELDKNIIYKRRLDLSTSAPKIEE